MSAPLSRERPVPSPDTTGLNLVIEHGRREASLWRRLNEGKCREEIFDLYAPLARAISAKEFRCRPPYGLERTDFDQLAYSGLLQAIDRFDPLGGCRFQTFARYRIVGAIVDGLLRSSEQAEHYRAVRRADRDRIRSLTPLSESPTDAVLALRDLVGTLAVSVLVETITMAEIEGVADEAAPNGFESLRWNQIRRLVMDGIRYLPTRESTIVRRHYFEDLTFKVIAIMLRLSKGRVSQLHAAAIGRLRSRLSKLR